jgi:hypothetical protein
MYKLAIISGPFLSMISHTLPLYCNDKKICLTHTFLLYANPLYPLNKIINPLSISTPILSPTINPNSPYLPSLNKHHPSNTTNSLPHPNNKVSTLTNKAY